MELEVPVPRRAPAGRATWLGQGPTARQVWVSAPNLSASGGTNQDAAASHSSAAWSASSRWK